MTPGPEGRHNNCRWRQPPVGEDEFFYSLLPRGLSAPAKGTAAPPGLVLWVNTRCGAAIKSPRNLLQARRADTATAGGDSHRIRCVNLLFFVLSPSQVIGSGVFAIARIRSVR